MVATGGERASIITKQTVEAETLLTSVQNELESILRECVHTCKANILKENLELREQIKDLRKELSQYENLTESENVAFTNAHKPSEESTETQKPKQSPKPKEAEARSAKQAKNETEKSSLPVDVGRLDFRIGHILSVEKHPDADSLYVEKIDVGEAEPRTVVSGLVKHMPAEELTDRRVVLICNLKPVKMRGVTSHAMVMCVMTPDKVEILDPPAGSVPGDIVECVGFSRNPDAVLNPKKKIFETCAPDLRTDDNCVATFKGAPLVVPGKGKITSKSLANVQIK